ncbi:MAG: glucose-6-phosphate isomerase [Rickettsiales bacterium]|jgi:glucose-6-phosphate isomerase|nr:glucose-6-phosphate isomerase [Rickettsiales bacterium]
MNFTETGAYALLKKHGIFLSDTTIAALFAENPDRFREFSCSLGDVIFDYSKNLVDRKARSYLLKMAEQVGLEEKIYDMFAGVNVNFTEGRAALHTALRSENADSLKVGGRDIIPDIRETLDSMCRFAEGVRGGRIEGEKGRRILDVVNIGIGGSHLGPMMAVEALRPYKTPLVDFHFVSNVDGTDIMETLKRLEPATTLFIVASKTFTTDETMANAATAREWLTAKLGGDAVERHFCAVSSNAKSAAGFGIPASRVFSFGDYVGGRYSMWGPVGLPIAIAVGERNFRALLHGAFLADEHFRTAGFADNIPVLMALVSIYNCNFLGVAAEAVLPYDHYLRYLPAYLQQLVMESDGKSVDSEGRRVKYGTSPIIFGEEGTNGQHSFYQLIHQGSEKLLCDFIVPVFSHNEAGDHHVKLLANALAQSEALMRGKIEEEALVELKAAKTPSEKIMRQLPYKVFDGNRPSNTFLVKKITPETLGTLIALWEHKTFVEGVLWDINPFDQMGVELGKQLAKKVVEDLKGAKAGEHDSSTSGLIDIIRELRKV